MQGWRPVWPGYCESDVVPARVLAFVGFVGDWELGAGKIAADVFTGASRMVVPGASYWEVVLWVEGPPGSCWRVAPRETPIDDTWRLPRAVSSLSSLWPSVAPKSIRSKRKFADTLGTVIGNASKAAGSGLWSKGMREIVEDGDE